MSVPETSGLMCVIKIKMCVIMRMFVCGVRGHCMGVWLTLDPPAHLGRRSPGTPPQRRPLAETLALCRQLTGSLEIAYSGEEIYTHTQILGLDKTIII